MNSLMENQGFVRTCNDGQIIFFLIFGKRKKHIELDMESMAGVA